MSCEEENRFHIVHNGNYLYNAISSLRPSDACTCVNQASIGSGKDLVHQTIIWTNANLLSTGP